ncbi:LLM class flavin-dependent oxidoreductase [Oceanobacillus piezotolerans]|uniref:LLM class flavin-dependent oxidoreductase n=2 Tax=Oceanobacillus piezotolerans TaxID=2448030 RepID=A0A498D7J0_9BACI|nr:LLM class flavin-dependent oxidoreductase [Oceanobacillus piezotolerans]
MLPGHHVSSWRYQGTKKEHLFNLKFLAAQAKLAEKGKFDMIFLADQLNINDPTSTGFEQTLNIMYEPFTLLGALAAVTEKIGLVGTASSTHNEPYNVARKFASLDQLSEGRSGWNVVTSGQLLESKNFSDEQPLAHRERYERAEEFVEVVTKLWDSWEEDAIVYDQSSGKAIDSSKVHSIHHKGEWFSVRGPLTVPASKQHRPIIIQAGSSESGKELAAKTAEVVFTAAQTIENAREFYRDLKGRLVKYGRQRDDLKIMPGVFIIIGRTEEEAKHKKQQLLDLVPEEAGLARLSEHLEFDLKGYPLDGPLPKLPSIEKVSGTQSRVELLKKVAEENNFTIRQLYQHIAGARGQRELVGTPEQIADDLQLWFKTEAADGFNILPSHFPDGFQDIVDLLIPELQRRGLFRREYEGDTLREHLGLKTPPNHFIRLSE